jgi:membrane protein
MRRRFAAAPFVPGAGHHPVDRLRSFFAEQIWNVHLRELSRGRALLYRVALVAYSTVRGFLDNRLTVRAAALTYYSVLSLVPFLAIAFSVLKGFGAYGSFVQGTVRPFVQHTFAGNPWLLGAIERILQFVDRTDVSKLGVVGLLVLIYTSLSLISSVEQALNEIWGARAARPFIRQVTDYVTLLVTAPLLVLAATTVATAAQSSDAMLFLRQSMALGPVIDLALRLAPAFVVGVAFLATYVILPNVHVRLSSALIGAAVSASLWQGALLLHVKFQMGVARYNALYSVLASVPIFLVWTYISWLVLLVGGQVAASHQNAEAERQRYFARRADQSLRETLAVVSAGHVAQRFLSGGAPYSCAALAARIAVPPLVLEEILEELTRSGLLARTSGGSEVAYLPGRDLDAIHINDVQDALRRDPRAEELRSDVERRLGSGLTDVLQGAEEERRRSSQNLTLREVAALLPAPEEAPAAGAAPADRPLAGREHRPVVDAKRPDLLA